MEAPIFISNISFPQCMMHTVLLEATTKLSDISTWCLVCRAFKQIADNCTYLHSLLIKLKGEEFSHLIYAKSPKNFLALDKDLTQIFEKLIIKKEKCCSRVKKISYIALKNLELNIFVLRIGSEIIYYQFPNEQEVKQLNEIDCVDRPKWETCLNVLAEHIASYKFPIQIKLYFPDNFYYLSEIKAAYANPDPKMSVLINTFKITNLFICDEQFLIINTHRGNQAKRRKLQDVILGPESKKVLLCKYDLQFYVNNNEWVFSLGNDSEIRESFISTLIKESQGKVEFSSTLPYASFLGLLISEIWGVWRERKKQLSLRLWTTNISIAQYLEGPKFHAITKTDSSWRKFNHS